MRFLKLTAIIAFFSLTISGCGQRGPLYLPKEPPAENQPSQEKDTKQSESEDTISAQQTTQDSILDSN